jgi:hypothetical protein
MGFSCHLHFLALADKVSARKATPVRDRLTSLEIANLLRDFDKHSTGRR